MNANLSALALISLFLLSSVSATAGDFELAPHAVSANPNPFEETQPDGTRVQLYIRGDEYFHWLEDPAGFTVVEDQGAFVYARKDALGQLAPTTLRVGRSNPAAAGLAPRTLPSPEIMQRSRQAIQSASVQAAAQAGVEGPQAVGAIGIKKNVVILLRFSNHTGRTLPSNSDFDKIFNAVGGDVTLAPTGSVRDYYLETSYGKLTLNSTVYGWVDLPQTEQYYANGNSGLDSKIWEAITGALNAADPLIDFSQFDDDSNGFVDSIAFVHSGYAAEAGGTDSSGKTVANRIWSHRWSIPTWTSSEGVKVSAYHINPGLWETSGTSPGRIGVICHETGHFFGLPDLYDTTAPGEGIGSFGLMANSWGFDGSQRHPPHMSAWSKIQLGWVTPTIVNAPGIYSTPQAETNEVIYRINNGYPSNEYLLVENRQPVGFESVLPSGGLAIYHIDDFAGYATQGYPGQSGWPENGKHYRVALLQADGEYHLERGGFGRGNGDDLFRAGWKSNLGPYTVPMTSAYQGGTVQVTNNVIDQISASSSNMTFRYSNTGPAQETAILDSISTRGRVLTGEEVIIGGFILEGDQPKTVLVRAIGPSLSNFGVVGALADPTLEVFAGPTSIGTNDDWKQTQQSGIEATGSPPTNNKESAILLTLDPGAYTAIVRGKDATTGVGLVEVFDVDESGSTTVLASISTRAKVETGDNVMIGGFIIGGVSPKTVKIQAVGPSLAPFGVTGVLADPTLQLFSGSTLLAENDDWQTGAQKAEIQHVGAPGHTLEPAIIRTLDPGPYTAIVRGVNLTTGVSRIDVVEVVE